MFNKLKRKEYEAPEYEQPVDEEVDEEIVKEDMVKEEEIEEEKRKIVIVRELPTQPLREIKLDDGTIVDLITTEEYLTKLANEED